MNTLSNPLPKPDINNELHKEVINTLKNMTLTLSSVTSLLNTSIKDFERSKIIAYYLINMILKTNKTNNEKNQLMDEVTV